LPESMYLNRHGLIPNTPEDKWQLSQSLTPSEVFADMFVAWVYGGWVNSGEYMLAGRQRRELMEGNMAAWVRYASSLPPWGAPSR
jgi:hypothetical protein